MLPVIYKQSPGRTLGRCGHGASLCINGTAPSHSLLFVNLLCSAGTEPRPRAGETGGDAATPAGVFYNVLLLINQTSL